MEQSNFSLLSTKNKAKIVKGIISRQNYSPFRSSKVKRSLNYTSQPPLIHKFSKNSPIRSRISPYRAFISDLQPLRLLISPNSSTSDSVQSRYQSMIPEEALNFVQTPSTIKEEEPLVVDIIEESLANYFNFEVNSHFTHTPVPFHPTPDVRGMHRYKNTMPCEILPHRSETPEIPTRKKEDVNKVKLPDVQNKFRNGGRKGRSPSPMEYNKRNKVDKNKIFFNFRKK